MDTKELLKQRYLVIADYPRNDLGVGHVINFTEVDHKGRPIYNFGTERDDITWVKPGYFEQFPAIFRPLSWWENRKVEDMPKYLVIGTQFGRQVVKVNRYDDFGFFYTEVTERYLLFGYTKPATPEEYTTYTNNSNEKV